MKTYNELPGIINELHFENYYSASSYQDGVNEAIKFFKYCGIDGEVTVDKIKEIKTYDEESNTTITTHIYECYVDSGSVDYFHFSFDTEF